MKRFFLLAPLLFAACGPKAIEVKGSDVKQTVVRPKGAEPTFCPGSTFEVEVVAQLTNGENCSTATPGPCGGSSDAILAKKLVVVTATDGIFDPESMTVRTNSDPLVSADGMLLRGWVVGAENKRATTTLRPVYHCMSKQDFGANYGEPGPNVEVVATMIKTPFYPQVMLVRLRSNGSPPRYVMAPPGMPVRVISRGGDGIPGAPGESGSAGQHGKDGSSSCDNGGPGAPGGAGGPGGPGGDGGNGGSIVAYLDPTYFAALSAQLELFAPGGGAGYGGSGGAGGQGGSGGSAGSSDSKKCPSGGMQGTQGASGPHGPQGPSGHAGLPGPPPKKIPQPREATFMAELGRIDELSRAQPKK
jgi:hypothetical protein